MASKPEIGGSKIVEKSEDLALETVKSKEENQSIGIVEKSEGLEFVTMNMKETGAKDEESKTESYSSSQNPTAATKDEYEDDGDYSGFRAKVHPCLQKFNDMMLAALGPQLKRRKMMEPPSVPQSPPRVSPPRTIIYCSKPRPTKSYIY